VTVSIFYFVFFSFRTAGNSLLLPYFEYRNSTSDLASAFDESMQHHLM